MRRAAQQEGKWIIPNFASIATIVVMLQSVGVVFSGMNVILQK